MSHLHFHSLLKGPQYPPSTTHHILFVWGGGREREGVRREREGVRREREGVRREREGVRREGRE